MDATSENALHFLPQSLTTRLHEVEEIQNRIKESNKEANRCYIDYTMEQVNVGNPVDTKFEKIDSGEISDYLKDKLKGKILDVGSGSNKKLDYLGLDGQITYLDLSSPPNSNAVLADAKKLPFKNGSFESIYCSLVIYDQTQFDKDVLSEMIRVVSSGGNIIIRPTGDISKLLYTIQGLGLDLEHQCNIETFNFISRHAASGVDLNHIDILVSLQATG